LSNLPIKEYQLIGRYYLGWYACCSEGNFPPSLFENIFEQSKTYKAKSLITLGALAGARGDLETEMQYQKEALKHSDLATSIRILKAIAIVKSKEGFHKSAVRSLQAVLPILRFARPQVYYDTLNSLAVELGEVGRIEEASNISRIVLASPFAFAYPEWRETGQELALRGYKSRSVVSVLKPALDSNNVVPIPMNNNPSLPQQEHARVFDLQAWREKMVKEPNGDDETLPEDMSVQDMAMKILELITDNKDDEENIRKLMESAIKIFSGKK